MTLPKFFMVGGNVRDKFMNRLSNDIDWVVVGATPEWMLANGFKQVGADFPVFLDDNGVEHALARTERKVGAGYHGFETVHDQSVTLKDDLLRRDLTINAIAFDPESNEFIDPFGGIKDIKSGILRHVSEAFREDPVRVLRLARFSAQFNFVVAPETNTLAKDMVETGELNHLTKERIWKEFEKVLNAPHPENFFCVMRACGALKVVFPTFNKHFPHVIKNVMEYNRSANRTAITMFARIMTMFNPATVEKFCVDYTVPNEFKACALFHSRLVRRVTMKHFLSPLMVIDVMNEHGVFRGNHVFLNAPWDAPYITALKAAWEITKSVSFQDLSPEQKVTLKGKEIGKAIDDLRAKKLCDWNP